METLPLVVLLACRLDQPMKYFRVNYGGVWCWYLSAGEDDCFFRSDNLRNSMNPQTQTRSATSQGLKTNGSTLPHVRNKFYELYEVGMDSNGPACQPKVRKNVNDTLVEQCSEKQFSHHHVIYSEQESALPSPEKFRTGFSSCQTCRM